ncbi:beta family protein [Rheinheimera soli]|uniref:beta family protein n=1 Tax=Rheinheimera soli TaxID=443616 RepID=UPI001E42E6D0|nr:beta family protein [Rheinheimera soli]
MSKKIYYPLVKTRDAEIKGIRNLRDDVKDCIIPVFELTRSRISQKTNPDGDIHKRMRQVSEAVGDRQFILDICTSPKYLNVQLEQLLVPDHGFYEWQQFLKAYSDLKIIPALHIYSEDDFSEVVKFIQQMSTSYNDFSLRLPIDLDDPDKIVSEITRVMPSKCTLHLLWDTSIEEKLITQSNYSKFAENISRSINSISEHTCSIYHIMTGSSFPLVPADLGDDDKGSFPIYEEIIFSTLQNKFREIKYGDYGSVCPKQVEMKGGTFVPRIDISLKDRFIYRRYRRGEDGIGGYKRCANEIVHNSEYTSLNCWADEQIAKALIEPEGKSPAYWLAIRVNYYITSRVRLRKN